ncbi:hypothetical protein L7F22_057386 [Adiantum nelumboides]|nr:hypothetical protein [Adiantum nelumboides]
MCESGPQQGSSETGGAVAVSALFYKGTSEGQLPDCTSLCEGGEEVGSVWGVEAGEDGGAKEDFGCRHGSRKARASRGGEVLCKPEVFNVAPSIRVGNLTEKMMKHEVPIVADESLEACVMSCRKREQEDSLGEVVQRIGGGGSSAGGQKIKAGEWLSKWNDLGEHTSTIAVDEKLPPGHLEDLDLEFGLQC